jgi:hypothetical protein
MVDVFVPPDFFPAVASETDTWELKELKLLYTFRSADREFNARLPVGSIPYLLVPGLEMIKIRIQPEAEDKPGMTACIAAAAEGVVETLLAWKEDDAAKVKRLDLSAFALEPETVGLLSAKFSGVREVAWAVGADGKEGRKEDLMKAVGRLAEELEVVACPGLEFYGAVGIP